MLHLVEKYLVESGKKTPAEKSNNFTDAGGKYFELHFGHHLKHLLSGGNPEEHNHGVTVDHFRDSSGASPKEVGSRIENSFPEKAAELGKIKLHAHAAAAEVHKRLTSDGKSASNAAWTSQPSDHESMTGRHDKNASGDVMVQTHNPKAPAGQQHSFLSISLKHGSNEPNLKNAGVASLEKMSGAKLLKHADDHMGRMHEIGMVGHKAFKQELQTPEKTSQVKATFGLESNMHARKSMVADMHGAMEQKRLKTGTDDHIKNFVKASGAPNTVYPVMRVHAKTDKKAGDLKQVDVHEPNSHMASLLNDHHDFRTEHSGGISMGITATHTKTGKRVKIADQAIKAASGATGFAGTFKFSPYANKYHS